ncbi:type ISP restriction/modification enzyme [Mongoliibacter ruber]|uniref:site-specific DNA-methyltransferase (adenine-specific) n=1 Tax=Mongoliibacter ruber TaxID=1750599 RepID=A0A2T0WV78_9BACT|nr:type ISP restriction/modification enzyme [Mongoliibacter ruber]PRY90595.1 hypothetical protein CLW00_101259 [Mongoliibacter ruber]
MSLELNDYIGNLNRRYRLGNATEHTFRGDLQNLIETLVPGVAATNEPKRIKCGAPDYVITKKDIPIGYIEAKDIGVDLRSKVLKEQFDRYRESLENLIITDYLDFHFYINGELVKTIAIAEIKSNGISPLPAFFEEFTDLIRSFCSFSGQTIRSPKKLAEMMAGKAKLLARIIENSLNSDASEEVDSSLKDQYTAFQQILINDIKTNEFADVYAQTIAYGMFAARLYDQTLDTFSRKEAAELIPKSNPFLRRLFQYIAGYDLDERIVWIVDALADIFRATDVASLLKNFGKSTKQEDPIIHFYETFLANYDPKLRKARGVWYTPEPVVDFIVRAVDDILKTEFDLPDGLADTSKTKIKVAIPTHDHRFKGGMREIEQELHRVQILDPATGTGTFLAKVIDHIHQTKFANQKGIWSQYVENHLIPRLNGFELLMASYAMAHLKLDLLLMESGYKPSKSQRFRVYLTNSLEEHHKDTGTLFASWLSAEANEANQIKRDTPVMCIIGNPPYSGESANKGEWIMKLMEDYKKEPGGKEKLKERNPKWINDDYVKFLRYGQHFIEKNGSGVLAFINPHGFLDNPTFRGMRWNLLKTYDKIYTIDLHGNSKKKETAPDGSIDQNVFDIQQGVSINLFIKTGNKKLNDLGKLFHFDLFGKREMKYDFLKKNSLRSISYKEIPINIPLHFFVDKDFESKKQYDNGFSISKIFESNSVGIVTARDHFTIHSTKNELKSTIELFMSLEDEIARTKFKLGKDVRDWQINFAKKDLEKNYPHQGVITQISYRPFDLRWTFYTGKSKGFHCYPRTEVMKNFTKENIGLVYKLGNSEEKSASVMVSKNMIDFRSWSRPGMQGGDYIAPLFLYDEIDDLFTKSKFSREPNLNPKILKEIEKALGLGFIAERPEGDGVCYADSGELRTEYRQSFAPIDLLDYIYAVLHSPAYREKYKEFLKIDFPRVPYPTDQESFWKLVELGGQIRKLHLMESSDLQRLDTGYPEDGDNVVEKPHYKNGQVHINATQYFENVPQVAWEFYIGGYQPAQKWLKDRKGRQLSYEDILHYQKIIKALQETDRLMKEIDEVGSVS